MEAVLASWLRDVRQLVDLGQLVPRRLWNYPGRVDSEDLAWDAASWTRSELAVGWEPLGPLVDVCERAGQCVLVADLPGDGASLVDGDIAVAVVSLRGEPGRRRATAAHELGHLILGDEYSTDLGVHASRVDREALIDAFAAELLLPGWMIKKEYGGLDEEATYRSLLTLAATYRTSWSLALRQAQRVGVIDTERRRSWSSQTPTRAEFMEAVGWQPLPDLESVRVPPRYAHAVMSAWRRGQIGRDRAVELMHGQIAAEDLPPREDEEPAP